METNKAVITSDTIKERRGLTTKIKGFFNENFKTSPEKKYNNSKNLPNGKQLKQLIKENLEQFKIE